jgi:integrase
MRGGIRERKSKTDPKGQSTWEITIYTRQIDPKTGKRGRHYVTFVGTETAAKKKRDELAVDVGRGNIAPVSGKMTTATVLASWLDSYVKTNCSPRTYDGYASIIRTHLVPSIGKITLRGLTGQSVQAYYGRAMEKLSHTTVSHHHRVLSEAMKWAIEQGYLSRNPCDMARVKVQRKTVMRTLTPGELAWLLECGRDSFYYPVIYAAVSTGLRQSELLGLKWRDIDLTLCTINVSRTLYKRGGQSVLRETKTRGSRRSVSMTPKLAAFLRQYQTEREGVYLHVGRVLSLDDMVFTSVAFEPLNPSVVSHNFHLMTVKAGLPGVRFHDMRHTFASLMLMRGAKPKVISEALGHASVAFTMDTYSHIIEGMQRDAMNLLDEVIPVGRVNNINVKLTSNHRNITGNAVI